MLIAAVRVVEGNHFNTTYSSCSIITVAAVRVVVGHQSSAAYSSYSVTAVVGPLHYNTG